MALQLYRRHRVQCVAGHPDGFRSSELDERRKGWGRKCRCVIQMSGTLGGEFSRKSTGTADWAEAYRTAEAYAKADSWTGKPKPEPVAPEPASNTTKPRITIEDACFL